MKNILTSPIKIKNISIKNRIVVPAMVCAGYLDENGYPGEQHAAHYASFASGGAGLIVQESAIVSPEGAVTPDMCGIWDETSIGAFAAVARAVHENDGVVVLQLCHGGAVAMNEVNLSPSDYQCVKNGQTKTGRMMSTDEIRRVQDDYVQAALRAVRAGYNGVELHGCHRYLISQFLNTRVNTRSDEYGANPLLFVTQILSRLKDIVPDDFIVGMRLGAYEPDLATSISYAKALEAAGVHYFSISTGCTGEYESSATEDYPYNELVFAADRIRAEISVPVFAVRDIRSSEEAQNIFENTAIDGVCIGRAHLVNPQWVSDALEGRDTGRCYECQPCLWHSKPEKCPGRKKLAKQKSMLMEGIQ